MNGGSPTAMHVWGAALVSGRLMHAFGLFQRRNVNRWRQLGMVLTWLAMLGMALSLLLRVSGA